MKLQTEIVVNQEQNQIDYSSKILLLGSCFTENIGSKLNYFKFRNFQNPFGIIFNPVSIEKLIARAITDNAYTEKDIFEKEGYWHCFEVHSLVTSSNKDTYLVMLNQKLGELKKWIQNASHIICTYGTAWVYVNHLLEKVVANCHKVPQNKFDKKLLSVAEISESVQKIQNHITSINPKIQTIATISPVRHAKDGFVENMRSKAHLIAGVHTSIDNQENSFYFPSFEIMMDELRGYRFYALDMIHPNETAIAIIWEKFKKAWISKDTEQLQKEIGIIQKGISHRPFYPEGEEHQKFLISLRQKIDALKKKLPFVVFDKQ